MENIEELLVNLKNEIINELPDSLTPSMESVVENVVNTILDDYFEEKIENAVTNVIQGLNDDETAKDRLYVLSQDKEILAPITYAVVHKSHSQNPKWQEYPFVITARIGIFANEVFGRYKDEESAKSELKNIFKALKFAEKNKYAVYEMN